MKVLRLLPILGLPILAAAAAGAQVISIAEARGLPVGSVVTVEGSVTVPSGVFASSTFDQGFAIEDDTAGIYVSTAENPNLNFHRRVRVTGTLADNGVGLLTVVPASLADVVILKGASPVEPIAVATGDVSEGRHPAGESVTGRSAAASTANGSSRVG